MQLNTREGIAREPWGARAGELLTSLPMPFQVLRAMRPHQWSKNAVVYSAFVFSASVAWHPREPDTWAPLLLEATIAFAVFCAITSGQYLINDVIDAERDAEHPVKRFRPIASGQVSKQVALATAAILSIGGIALAASLGPLFVLAAAGYVALTLAYTLILKHLVIVDVIAISVGFGLRAVAGAVAIEVEPTQWLYALALVGALFLAVAKRQQEQRLLGSEGNHRQALSEYTPELLAQMSTVSIASIVVLYSLFAATAANLPLNNSMLATVPFVLYGLFRYQHIAHLYPGRGPDELVLRDRPLMLSVLLFGIVSLAILIIWRDATALD